jgi:micrococcal nuclease
VKLISLIVSVLLISSIPAFAFDGLVTSVHDGDTITVINEKKVVEKVRLHRIDSPEMKGSKWQYQPYANEAQVALSNLCLNEVATIVRKGVSYDRTVGEVSCKKTIVSDYMIRTGHAWAYRYSALKSQKLLQTNAQISKVGLWALSNPVEPLLWRQGVK